MPQCLEADSAAFSKSDRPTSDTVGTIVNGVTYLTTFPIRPEIITFLISYVILSTYYYNIIVTTVLHLFIYN